MIKGKSEKMINILRKFFIFSVSFAPLNFVIAQGDSKTRINFENPLGSNSVLELIAAFLDFVVQVGTIIAVFFVIYSGFLFVVARGKPEELTKAKKALMYTLIGAVILIGAQALSILICKTAIDLGGKGRICGG